MGRRPKIESADDIINLAGSSFMRWLKTAMSERDMGVSDLAQLSGVSTVAIYNIIKGLTPNPQKGTKDKLAKALHREIPKVVLTESSLETSIFGLGDLADFDPFNDDELPTCSGVYVFYDIAGRPLYIGQSKSIVRRVKTYKDKFWFRSPMVHTGAFIQIDDESLRKQVEQVLIKFLKNNAVLNKQHADRSE